MLISVRTVLNPDIQFDVDEVMYEKLRSSGLLQMDTEANVDILDQMLRDSIDRPQSSTRQLIADLVAAGESTTPGDITAVSDRLNELSNAVDELILAALMELEGMF